MIKGFYVDDGLEKTICCETGEASTCSLFRSPMRQSLLTLYSSFTQKIILKRLLIDDTLEDSALLIIFQFFQETGHFKVSVLACKD